jgi:hypothetical protein
MQPNPLCYDFNNIDKFLASPSTLSKLGVSGIKWQSCNYTVNAQFSAGRIVRTLSLRTVWS